MKALDAKMPFILCLSVCNSTRLPVCQTTALTVLTVITMVCPHVTEACNLMPCRRLRGHTKKSVPARQI